jgi:hypothetical protein
MIPKKIKVTLELTTAMLIPKGATSHWVKAEMEEFFSNLLLSPGTTIKVLEVKDV